MPVFTTKRYEQILAQMIAKVVTRSRLSDVSDTSLVKHVLAAAARQDDEQYFQMSLILDLFSIDTATGEDLDQRAREIQPGTITRNPATKATGNLVFSRTGTSGTVPITVGTRCKTAGNVLFSTTIAGQISDGDTDSSPISAIAEEPGTAGNVASLTIVRFDTKPAGVDSVSNPSAFGFGTNEETDDAFRNRLKDYIAALPRSTLQALESGVLGAQDPNTGATIQFARGVEDPIDRGYVVLYIDDGTGSTESSEAVVGDLVTEGLGGGIGGDAAVGGEEVLFLNYGALKASIGPVVTSTARGVLSGGYAYSAVNEYWINSSSGQINFAPPLVADEGITADYTRYTGLIALAQRIVDGDENDRVTYPGLRAAGVMVTVQTPTNMAQTVDLSVTILEGYDNDSVKLEVQEVIMEYVNSLGISGDVLVAEIYKRTMDVRGVYNCTVTNPVNDVIILDDQLARIPDLGSVTVT